MHTASVHAAQFPVGVISEEAYALVYIYGITTLGILYISRWHINKDIVLLEKMQKKVNKIITRSEHLSMKKGYSIWNI